MDMLWISLTLLTAAGWITWLVRVVRDDGLGHREPPRSHPHEAEVPATHVFSR
ncbi:hypothetical protein [Cellulomonas sp. KH9]|uniref:hypothetical protein n=1 Tax=Cellulomonas sp. KH9 TaxID=1855324 RepID=UPI0015A6519F|nr:hypothetical protein [Cellulomonas sp. KH9]